MQAIHLHLIQNVDVAELISPLYTIIMAENIIKEECVLDRYLPLDSPSQDLSK